MPHVKERSKDTYNNKCFVWPVIARESGRSSNHWTRLGHGFSPIEALGLLDAPLSRGMTVCDSIIVAAIQSDRGMAQTARRLGDLARPSRPFANSEL
jgi:hypothetical protein